MTHSEIMETWDEVSKWSPQDVNGHLDLYFGDHVSSDEFYTVIFAALRVLCQDKEHEAAVAKLLIDHFEAFPSPLPPLTLQLDGDGGYHVVPEEDRLPALDLKGQ